MRLALAVATAMALALGLSVAAVRNLPSTALWWDEAQQLWVALGQSGYAPPGTPAGGVLDVIRWNRRENLDPGGFSLLLHTWMAAGTGLVWVRALPFAFFLVGCAALGALGWRLTRSAPFALAAAALPVVFPAGRHFAFEVRAYSMEMAGVACAALALAAAVERPSVRRAAALGTVCALFLSSRYSFALVVVPVLAAFAVTAAGRLPGAMSRARVLGAVALPVVIAAVLAWFATFRAQVLPVMRGGPVGLASPPYTNGSVLARSADPAALLLRNLLSGAALPLTACALFVAFARARGYAGAQPASRRVFSALHAVVLTTLALTAGASLAGAYPWDIATRWSAYLQELAAVAAVAVTAELLAMAGSRGGAAAARARATTSALALLVVAVASGRAATYRYSVAGVRNSDVAVQVAALPADLADGSVLVGLYQRPILRYHFEHGPLTGRPEFPRAFRFESIAEWKERAPFDAAREHIAFVVVSAPPQEVRARFPGVEIRPIGRDGGPPFEVVKSAATGM